MSGDPGLGSARTSFNLQSSHSQITISSEYWLTGEKEPKRDNANASLTRYAPCSR